MDVLEYHSVDVNPVFNHYMSCSFGFLTTTNGFLTSLAVLTAVVSCWKLRSSLTPPPTTTHKPSSQVPPPLDHVATETSQLSSDIDKQVPTEATYSGSSLVSSLDDIAEEEEDADMTKSSATDSPRKFTVMYYADVDNGEDEPTLFEYCRDVVEYENPATAEGDFVEDNQKILVLAPSTSLRTIKGNNGLDWYMYQDLSMLNGNVVKLWDCKKQRKNSRISLASSSLSAGIVS